MVAGHQRVTGKAIFALAPQPPQPNIKGSSSQPAPVLGATSLLLLLGNKEKNCLLA